MSTNVTNTVQSDETVMTREEFVKEQAAEIQEMVNELAKETAPKPKAPKIKPRFYDIKDKHGKVISPRRYSPKKSGFDQRQLAAFNKGRFAKPQTVKCDTYLGEDGNKIPQGRLDPVQAQINYELGYWE